MDAAIWRRALALNVALARIPTVGRWVEVYGVACRLRRVEGPRSRVALVSGPTECEDYRWVDTVSVTVPRWKDYVEKSLRFWIEPTGSETLRLLHEVSTFDPWDRAAWSAFSDLMDEEGHHHARAVAVMVAEWEELLTSAVELATWQPPIEWRR